MTTGRTAIIPILHGNLTADGQLTEPDIDAISEKRLERHPEFRGQDYHFVGGKKDLPGGIATALVRVTADFSPELAAYDPATDADLYQELLAEKDDSPPPEPHKIWIKQCEAARGIEDEFGTDRALKYLVDEKFINFLEVAEDNADLRAEIPAFVVKIKTIFEPWQLRECLDQARQTEPFDPADCEPDEDHEGEAPEIIEMLRQDDVRHDTRDLPMMERAREWLLEE